MATVKQNLPFIFLIIITIFHTSSLISMDLVKGAYNGLSDGASYLANQFGKAPETSEHEMPTIGEDCDRELEALLDRTDALDQTPNHQWSFIINGYCSRAEINPGKNKTELYQRVYHDQRLQRAALLLSHHEKKDPLVERSIDPATLEELRIVPSRETGIIDKLVAKMGTNSGLGRISRASTTLLARLLCSHKLLATLEENQNMINLLAQRGDIRTFDFIDETAQYENYFMASFCHNNSSEIKSHVKTLKGFFPNAETKDLVRLACCPLLHAVYDQFSIENFVQQPIKSLNNQKAFWNEHIGSLSVFLLNLQMIGSSLPPTPDFEKARTQLNSTTLKESCTKLKNLLCQIGELTSLDELNEKLSSDFFPILSSHDEMVAAYNAWAHITLSSHLSKLTQDGTFNCAQYIGEAKHPIIRMNNGRCLLVDNALPYSVDFDNGQKPTTLVTGDNFSGKSIFMQTVGSNVHLALSIGIVAAQSLTLTPMNISTSCNVRDSIGTSSLEAQSQRVGSIVKKTKNGDFSLVILDEPITKTADEVVNAVLPEVLTQLQARPWVIGLMSTHHSEPKSYVDKNPQDFSHITVKPDHTLTIQ